MRRAGETGSWTSVGSWTNGAAAVLVASLAISRRWHQSLVTLVVAALFLLFLVDAALQLR